MSIYISRFFLFVGTVFISIGIFGQFRFKNFYDRISIASLIDTVGFISIMTGVIIENGFSFFSLKVLLILFITLIINPLITHSITRSAHKSGYVVRKE